MKYRNSVFVVVYSKVKNKIEYLILKRKLHWKGWEFPKGGIDFRETKIEAVKREIKEETGLKILKIKKFNASGKFRYNKKFSDRPGLIGQKYSLYAVEVKKSRSGSYPQGTRISSRPKLRNSERKIKLDRREHSDYKWLEFNDAVKKLTWENQRKCLKIVDDWGRR